MYNVGDEEDEINVPMALSVFTTLGTGKKVGVRSRFLSSDIRVDILGTNLKHQLLLLLSLYPPPTPPTQPPSIVVTPSPRTQRSSSQASLHLFVPGRPGAKALHPAVSHKKLCGGGRGGGGGIAIGLSVYPSGLVSHLCPEGIFRNTELLYIYINATKLSFVVGCVFLLWFV